MNFQEMLRNDMIQAMKQAKQLEDPAEVEINKTRVSVIRAALAGITEAETKGKSRTELDTAGMYSVIRKMIKQREDSAETYKGVSQERADRETLESEILSEYVPKQLSESDTREIVTQIITENNLEGMKAIGRVMGALKGRADVDSSLASRIAKEILS